MDILQKEQSFPSHMLLEASAGTGKTFFIAHFVVRSILEGIAPEEIAAITFTKKAAAELQERIFTLLDEALEALVQKEARFGYLEAYLENPILYQKGMERLLVAKGSPFSSIGTIHHFASLLLSQFSFTAHVITPHILQSFAKVVQECLENTPVSLLCKMLLSMSVKREKGWRKWIESLYMRKDHKKDSFQSKLSLKAEELVERGSSLLLQDPMILLQTNLHILPWITSFKGAKALQEKAMAFGLDLAKALKKEIPITDLLHLYPELLALEEKKKKIEPVPNLSLQKFLEDELLPYFRLITSQDFILGLFYEMIEPKWEQYRKQEHLVGFDDLLEEVVELIQNTQIQKQIVKSYPLLIVDEFQDTDPLQWKIISTLYLHEEDKRLVLVGDPKQSIYGFRKADLHIYLQAALHPKLVKFTLRNNFRSAPLLLQSLNLLLNSPHSRSWSWIPQNQDLIEVSLQEVSLREVSLLEVPLLTAKSTKTIPQKLGAAIEIAAAIKPVSKERNFPGSTWESKVAFPYIIQEIKRLSSSVPLKEICILIEDRYQGFRLKAALEKAHIPALIDRSFDIRDSSELFALAKMLFAAISNPHSATSIATLLHSPLFNGDLHNLDIATKNGVLEGQIHLQILGELFVANKGLFFATLLKKPLYEGGLTLEEGISQLDKTLYEGATRGFWFLWEKLITASPEHLQQGIEGLLLLLDSWQQNLDAQDAWSIPKEENAKSVLLMTCFAAKGLEFDVVFALHLASRSTFDTLEKREEIIAETLRQLYVAITRPKLKLYLLIALGTSQKDQINLERYNPSPLELFFAQMLEGEIDLKAAMLKTSELNFEKLEKITTLLVEEGASIHLKKIDASMFSIQNDQQDEELFSQEHPMQNALQEDQTTKSISKEVLSWPFPPMRIEPLIDLSFTSLRSHGYATYDYAMHGSANLVKEGSVTEKEILEFPSGKEIGDWIHKLFHNLFTKGLFIGGKREERNKFAKSFLHTSPLKEYLDPLMEKVNFWLSLPLFDGIALEELPPDAIQSEMEFLFDIDQDGAAQRIKGSIDLCVTIQNKVQSKVWILDWKTHLLPPDTSQEDLRKLVEEEGYLLQAKIYGEAIQKWLSLFANAPRLQNVLFCFLHCKEPVVISYPEQDKLCNPLEDLLLTSSKKRSLLYE